MWQRHLGWKKNPGQGRNFYKLPLVIVSLFCMFFPQKNLNMHHSLANPTNRSRQKRPLSGPELTLVSLNIKGLTPQKEIINAEMVRESLLIKYGDRTCHLRVIVREKTLKNYWTETIYMDNDTRAQHFRPSSPPLKRNLMATCLVVGMRYSIYNNTNVVFNYIYDNDIFFFTSSLFGRYVSDTLPSSVPFPSYHKVSIFRQQYAEYSTVETTNTMIEERSWSPWTTSTHFVRRHSVSVTLHVVEWFCDGYDNGRVVQRFFLCCWFFMFLKSLIYNLKNH